ncbi:Crp/Fnr family transcriptional regulator [Kitasatospora sp. NPDC092948]|uniref:Crp/Fnr family transcriptional regulator n=1 Tax=Kitasatospora sp. NPDC092948 TaxID=3364088 RepID=UPI0038142CD6
MTEAAAPLPHDTTDRTLRQLMGESVWSAMLDGALVRRHPIGSTLLRQGEEGQHVLALVGGVAKVLRHERGGELTLLAFRGPGELLGEVAVLDGGVRSANVLSITDCTVAVLAKPTFLHFVAARGLYPVLVRYALARLRESDLARAGGDILPRLAAALLTLADLSAAPSGEPVELALTREELAQHLGVSRNTVSAGLGDLGPFGVQPARKRILLTDLPALRGVGRQL